MQEIHSEWLFLCCMLTDRLYAIKLVGTNIQKLDISRFLVALQSPCEGRMQRPFFHLILIDFNLGRLQALTGTIPQSWTGLPFLTELSLEHNQVLAYGLMSLLIARNDA